MSEEMTAAEELKKKSFEDDRLYGVVVSLAIALPIVERLEQENAALRHQLDLHVETADLCENCDGDTSVSTEESGFATLAFCIKCWNELAERARAEGYESAKKDAVQIANRARAEGQQQGYADGSGDMDATEAYWKDQVERGLEAAAKIVDAGEESGRVTSPAIAEMIRALTHRLTRDAGAAAEREAVKTETADGIDLLTWLMERGSGVRGR